MFKLGYTCGQDRTGQDRTGQDRTGQDRLSVPFFRVKQNMLEMDNRRILSG